MASGLSVICFTASYLVALALEVVGLKIRFGWHRLVMLIFAVLGLVAHSLYLGNRAAAAPAAPLATAFDWCLSAAWVLALIYLTIVFQAPKSAAGMFILPLCLLLIGVAQLASREPFAVVHNSRLWSLVHGGVLLGGTVTVCIGFLAGLMYLIQSYRLKKALPPLAGFRLPSLEHLDLLNSRSLAVSTLLMGLGFVSGIILSEMKHQQEAGYSLWTDPVVLSLSAMLGWLILADIFRIVYPAARTGRKVAYLTLAAFVFLAFTLFSMTTLDKVHGNAQNPAGSAGASSSFVGEKVP